MLADARRALAVQHAVQAMPRFNGRTSNIDAARRRARKGENAPTDEQEAKALYVETDVNEYRDDVRVKIGRAYRRHARFERIEGLRMRELLALRAYRKAFDESERSAVKSGLDIGAGGGGSPDWAAISRVEKLAFADHEVRRIEAQVARDVLFTLRLVALGDLDFKAVAIERFGSSRGRLRERVRTEFLAAATQLSAPRARAKAAPIDTPAAADEPAAPLKPIDPGFRDERGFMRPFAEIADLIRAGKLPVASRPKPVDEGERSQVRKQTIGQVGGSDRA